MEMSQKFGARGLVAILLLMATFSSCDNSLSPEALEPADAALDTDLVPPSIGGIGISPESLLGLLPGDTVTIRTSLNGRGSAVSFASTDTAIVTVTPTGLVTARAPGTAQIAVALRNNPLLRIGIAVVVHSRGDSDVRIERLVPLVAERGDSLAGDVMATLDVLRGDAVAYEVLLDTIPVCADALPATSVEASFVQRETIRCTFDTAVYDTVAGGAIFKNGPVRFQARLLGSGEAVLARSEALPSLLGNRDTVLINVLPEVQAEGQQGGQWIGGDVVIEARPLFYSRDIAARSATFSYRRPDGRLFEHVDTGVPYRTSLTRAQLAGFIDTSFQVTVDTRTSGGSGGPSGVSRPARYDGVAPTAGTLRGRSWVGAAQTFASFYTPSAQGDSGVGEITPRFFAAASFIPSDEIVVRGERVVRGSDLKESPEGAYRLVYRVCDALLNCSDHLGFAFGIDLQPPTVTSITLTPRSVNPTSDLRVTLSDERSGFNESPLEVAVIAVGPSANNAECGPSIAGIRLPGTRVNASCLPETTGTTIPVPQGQDGYLFYRLIASDRAGNRTETIERAVLIDRQAPQISSVTLPERFTPGLDFQLQAQVGDNVDLARVGYRLTFRGDRRFSLPFTPSTVVGNAYSGSIVRDFSATTRLPFVRTLTVLDPARSTVLVDSITVRATDAAGLITSRSEAIQPSRFGGEVSVTDPFPAVKTVATTVGAPVPCLQMCGSSDGTVMPASLRIIGDSGLSPFGRAYLFLRDSSGAVYPVGTTSAFSVADTGTQRTYTYAFSVSAPTDVYGEVTLFGVAINGSGNALMSAETQTRIPTR